MQTETIRRGLVAMAGIGLAIALVGCVGQPEPEPEAEAIAIPAVNEGFTRACLWFSNQKGYSGMAQAFYDDAKSQTVASWLGGLTPEQAEEVETFFKPYDEEWGRTVIVYMALDGSPPDSPEWINLQAKCLSYGVDVRFPRSVY